MRRTIIAATLAASLWAAPGQAGNLVTNGSFELGNNGLLGWTQTGSNAGFPAVSLFYGTPSAYPTGAFGEAVATNTVASLSPDAVGTRAAYFVDDFAIGQALTQQVFLDPGLYQIGFDAYAPANGYANAGDASFSAVIAGISLANYLISSGPATTWQNFSGLTTITTAGFYDVSFSFDTNRNPSKDVVIDRVYILSCETESCVRTAEPASMALLAAGLLGLGIARRRARS